MKLRFRKSVKAGPVRFTVGTKSGSVSVGGKGFRVTKSTTGRRTTTIGPFTSSKTRNGRKPRGGGRAVPTPQAFTSQPLPPLPPEELARRRRINNRIFLTAGVIILLIILIGAFL